MLLLWITNHEKDVWCLQQVDLEIDYPTAILTFKGYKLDTELTDIKVSCAIYIKDTIPINRRIDHKVVNTQVIIIDVDLNKELQANKHLLFV